MFLMNRPDKNSDLGVDLDQIKLFVFYAIYNSIDLYQIKSAGENRPEQTL